MLAPNREKIALLLTFVSQALLSVTGMDETSYWNFKCVLSRCKHVLTGIGAAAPVLLVAEAQIGGAEDVSRFLFCSRSFFTVGSVLHGFSFGAADQHKCEQRLWLFTQK